jgi:hypothetical protein
MKTQYLINVKNVDNRLLIFLNGNTIWDSGIVHGDPEMDVNIDLTSHLNDFVGNSCELIFEGFNDSYSDHPVAGDLNPWHFNYRIFSRTEDAQGKVIEEVDIVQPYNEKHLSNPNVKAINNRYQIVRKDLAYKVVSNSLSQQFYN